MFFFLTLNMNFMNLKDPSINRSKRSPLCLEREDVWCLRAQCGNHEDNQLSLHKSSCPESHGVHPESHRSEALKARQP